MSTDTTRRELTDWLFEQGKLTEKQLDLAKRHQRRRNCTPQKAVQELNLASEEDIHRGLAAVNNLEFVDLSKLELSKSVLALAPVKLIFHYRMVPLSLEGDLLTLAFSEPIRQLELGNLRLLLNKRLRIAITTPSSINLVIKEHFGLGAATIQKLRDEKSPGQQTEEQIFDVKASEESHPSDVTIADFVDQMLLEALRMQATDLHIEPYPSQIRLRYRIDGIMQSVPVPPGLRQFYSGIVSRLKIMSGLDISEKRLPQDGKIAMKTGAEEYDLRVSVIPTKHGESVVLRILGRQSLLLDLRQLGMDPAQESLFAELTQLPQGMVLITGPTGSGKTTTLYAALASANDASRKIITIEDPVEYQLDGVTQIPIREDIGMTFATVLRSVLRHDPDVVLVGEIRDAETAEIAVRAAQTGHLVFSTLHTNDSVSTVTRLLDMKIDPFLISSSLVCAIAQRLARRVCPSCAIEETGFTPVIRDEMAKCLGIRPEEVRARRGAGCNECGQKGCKGRVAMYEFFVVTDEVADLIGPDTKTGRLREAAKRSGWRSLRDQGWSKVFAGTIPIEEQRRLTHRIHFESPGGL